LLVLLYQSSQPGVLVKLPDVGLAAMLNRA
jgi:hypothetical protein